jgi:hypothetical protein
MASLPAEPDAAWTLAEGTRAGAPILVRRNVALAARAGDGAYPYQVAIAVALVEPDHRGLPGPEDFARLNAFEDVLAAILCHEDLCLFAAVITGGGMREFVFYTGDLDAVRPRAQYIRDGFSALEFRVMARPDPAWDVYATLVGMAGA